MQSLRSLIRISWALLLPGVCNVLWAEDLTWERAWELAKSQSVIARSSDENVTIAEQRVREAFSAALPNVSVSGMYSRNLETPVFFFNGEPIPFGLKNTYSAQAELLQPIWIAGKVGIGLNAARAYLRQARAVRDQADHDLRLQLMQAYYGTILARELVGTVQTALDRARQHRDRSRLLFEQGLVSEYDHIRAEVQVANLQPGVLDAQNFYEMSLDNLRRTLNLPPDDSLRLVESLELETSSPPAADWTEAWDRRSEVIALREGRNVQRQLMRLTQRDIYLPSFYGSLLYQTQSQADDFALDEYRWVNSSSARMIVSWPLFDGFRTPARVEQARAELRKLDYAEADLRVAVRNEVVSAHRELERAQETVRVQEDNVRVAERGYDIARVRYESGAGTQLELLDSELQLDQARVIRLRALYDARIARARLERAMGLSVDN